MYKKRLAKWGFQKSSKRSASTVQMPKTDEARRKPSQPTTELGSVPVPPRFSQHDSLKLMFLTSVRTWSFSFFEFVQTSHGAPESQQSHYAMDQPLLVNAKEICFAFKVMMDLLDKGHGILAGRIARKAFLLVEDMLILEGPALVWNLLEIMHSMIILRQAQLFHMLLAHLIALANGRIPEAHPLSSMLRGLQDLVADITNSPSNSDNCLSSSAASSINSYGTVNTIEPWILSHALPSLLEQAWVFNAKIVFDHFDPGLMQLYCNIFWDSCSISLPTAIVGGADQWINETRIAVQSKVPSKAYLSGEALPSNPVGKDKLLQNFFTPRMESLLSQDYEALRESSIAALRERGELIFSSGAGFNGDTSTLLGIVACLLTSKVFESWHATMGSLDPTRSLRVTRQQFYVGTIACALKTLMDLNTGGGAEVTADTVERIRTIVTLREYIQGEVDPQVVREMWLLEDALVRVGEYDEAQDVRREAYRRLEKYVQDIPPGSV